MKTKTSASQKSLDDSFLRKVMEGDEYLVRDSLSAGADIHAQEDYALRYSAEYGHIEQVRMLLDGGADIHAKDDNALRSSAWNGHIEVVRLILDRGADIHANDDNALYLAAKNGHIETVGLLLDRGADAHANSSRALHFAALNGNLDVAMQLIVHGADMEIGIEAARRAGNSRMLCLLNQISLSREEKSIISAEVPAPEQSANMIRM